MENIGIFYGHLVYFLVYYAKKNLATLFRQVSFTVSKLHTSVILGCELCRVSVHVLD
jgi:hypothetical protein